MTEKRTNTIFYSFFLKK